MGEHGWRSLVESIWSIATKWQKRKNHPGTTFIGHTEAAMATMNDGPNGARPKRRARL